jgi:hypothetical protein
MSDKLEEPDEPMESDRFNLALKLGLKSYFRDAFVKIQQAAFGWNLFIENYQVEDSQSADKVAQIYGFNDFESMCIWCKDNHGVEFEGNLTTNKKPTQEPGESEVTNNKDE